MRVAGWPRLLNEHLLEQQERYKQEGFSYAGMHCVSFVAEWLLTLTGVDYLEDYRGRYSTEEEAKAILAAEGSLYDVLVRRLGEPVHPAKGHRGDVAYVKIDDTEMIGVLFTSGAQMRALFLGEGGFALHRVRDMHHVFRIE